MQRKSMKVAISQPTYLPWMGYFGLIDVADLFIFLDDVQFEAQSWQQRNKIKTSKGWLWLTVPIVRQFGSSINNIKVNNSTNWSKKHWESIRQNYSKAPFFKDYAPVFADVYDNAWESLANLNIMLIKKIINILDLKTEIAFSSEFKVEGAKTERLINLLKVTNATEYISPPGSKNYIEAHSFEKNRIKLYWYEYQHPVYPQINGDFIPYLSVIDLLFNTGQKSLNYIKEGYKDSLKLNEIYSKC